MRATGINFFKVGASFCVSFEGMMGPGGSVS